jgi:hypothetical protein
MAATRPVVLVFQEFATLSSSPATPELNCLVAGPAYWIQDFPEDRADIQIADYGIAVGAAATGVAVVTSAVVVSDAPNNKIGAVLDQASVRVFTSSTQVELAAGNDMTTTVASPTVGSVGTNFITAGVKALDKIIMTDLVGPTTITRTVISVTANTLTLNSETPSGYGAVSVKFRIERTLPESEIDKGFYTFVPATNSIQVNALATLPVGVAQKRIVSAHLYVAYRSLRLDLQDVKTLGSVNEVKGQLGRIDSRNPLAVGVFVALQNTNTTVQYYGIGTNDLAGYTSMKNSIGGRKDIYAVVPLSSDILVLAMLKAEFVALADPDFALTNGVPQKFRVAIGSSAQLTTTKIVIDTNTDGRSEVNAALGVPTTTHTLTFDTDVNLVSGNVQPGDSLIISLDAAGVSRNGTYIVSQVLSAVSLELDTELPGGVQSGNASVTIKVGTSGTDRIAITPISPLATIADSKLYLDLYDPNGTFVDVGVIPTDLIEMPRNPTQTSFADKDTFQVALVVSNQRVRIVNNGRSTSLVAKELPHGVSRNSPATVIPNTQTQTYRITRTLDKTGQVTEIVAVAQSLASRRVVNVWPDQCDVGGLVDGSLPRDPAAPTTAQPAATQPGYYLACAVGGMTAGLPSHQGFTNLGIAGISKVYHANTYFSDKQITDISNGGWFVFQQDTPQALPYCVHQLTTDPSTLQSGEFSMVKNFDFVSLFFADIVDDFLGTWNVNPETIGFISAGIVGGIDNLKLRRRPRIGAPIIDGKVTSIAQSTSSADRVETFVEITFPAPLNIVALHLVSA